MAKTNENDTNSKVAKAMALMKKKFGEEAIMTFDGTSNKIKDIEVISTSSLKLDKALGGGVPMGRVVLLWGDFSSGKSTICLHTCANAQAKGKVVAYVDMEHALDPRYAKALGCNMPELLFSQPNSGEEALNICYELATSGLVDVIVLDSIAACVPDREIQAELGSVNIGIQARLFSDFFKKITPVCEKNSCLLLCTNQIRQKPGAYGDASVLPCGEAQKFYASIIMRTRKQLSQKEVDSYGEAIANQITVIVEKNKIAVPFKKVELMIYYGKGLSTDNEVFDMAVAYDIIHKAGGWFSYENEKWQGAAKVKAWLNEHLDVKEIITKKVEELMNKSETDAIDIPIVEDEDVKFDPKTGEILED